MHNGRRFQNTCSPVLLHVGRCASGLPLSRAAHASPAPRPGLGPCPVDSGQALKLRGRGEEGLHVGLLSFDGNTHVQRVSNWQTYIQT